jgi:hypothetical protein
MKPRLKSAACFLLTILHIICTADADESVEELESCDTLVKSFPKDNTDIDGNVFELKLSTVECKCAGNKMIRCVYTAEGTSKTSEAINYTADKCIAYTCTEEGKVCQTQKGWKQNSSVFDVTKFDENLYKSWCVIPEPPSDATMMRLRSAMFGMGITVFAVQ